MESALVAKYGSPNFKSDAPEYVRTWNFPNLKIEINSKVSYRPKMTKDGQYDDSVQKDDLVLDDSFYIEYSKLDIINSNGL